MLDNSVKEKEKQNKIIYLREIFGTAKNTKEQLRKHIYHPKHKRKQFKDELTLKSKNNNIQQKMKMKNKKKEEEFHLA